MVQETLVDAGAAGPPVPARRSGRVAEVARFGVVGAAAYVIDAGGYNLLVALWMEDAPVRAKLLSSLVATVVAFLGSRWWTFRREGVQAHPVAQFIMFVSVNVGAALVAAGCLAVSRYGLHLTSPLADNLSANVVGVGLGTLFRYVMYRQWVFRVHPIGAP